MSNLVLGPEISVPELAWSRYPVPLRSMLRSLNVAMPFTAATVMVPDRVPFPGFREIEMVTLSEKPGTNLFEASRASTVTAGILDPAIVLVGSSLNDNCEAGGGGPAGSPPPHVETRNASNAMAPYLSGGQVRSNDEKRTTGTQSWGTRQRVEEFLTQASRIHAH